ncbi:MAG: hypothetical protein J6Y77_07845, partial [Paludibacteraceae bacterium]|nr:hypothetical protein [Paludibacteraceae bacterium]
MNKLSSLLHQATFAGFLLLICTMIYGFSDFQRMVLYFFFGCTALEFVIDQKWRNYRWTKEKTWYSLVLLFFLLFYLYHLWEGSSTRFSYYSSFRYPLGGFAIAGLTGWNDRFRLRPVMYAFIGGSLLAMVHLLALADYSAVAGKGLLTVWQYSRIDHVNSHMVVNFFLNVSIVFIYAYLSTREGVSKGEKIALWAIGLVLAVCICLSEGRSGLLSLFIMLLLMAVIKIHQFA